MVLSVGHGQNTTRKNVWKFIIPDLISEKSVFDTFRVDSNLSKNNGVTHCNVISSYFATSAVLHEPSSEDSLHIVILKLFVRNVKKTLKIN